MKMPMAMMVSCWFHAGFLPVSWRRFSSYLRLRRQARWLTASEFFDAAWYRAQNKDCGWIGNPALHYLRRGAVQGRHPGPKFDGDAYRARYADVDMLGENPLLHYLRCGRAEGRVTSRVARESLPRLKLTDENYQRWVQAHDTLDDAARAAIRSALDHLPARPVFLLVADTRTMATAAWLPLLRSVRAQLYPDWRLLLLGEPASRAMPAEAEGDPRVVVVPDALATAGLRAALEAGGAWDFFLVAGPGLVLAETALFRLAAQIGACPEVGLLHADADRIDARGRRSAPRFGWAWEPDLGPPEAVIGTTCAIRRSLLADVCAGASGEIVFSRVLHDLAARHVPIRHVPAVLFHRLDAGGQPQQRGAETMVLDATDEKLVSVIVPTREHAGLLARCVTDVLQRTSYRNLEMIIVDNGSRSWRARRVLVRLGKEKRVRVLRAPGAFNWSALNNAAARVARGDILLLLNNDIRVLRPDWLGEMVALAQRPDVGVVGAKLLYPDGGVQHAGVVLGPRAVAQHVFRHAAGNAPGYLDMLSSRRSVAAVTGACLAIRRAVFQEIGGLEEAHLAVTGGDVDLCLRVRARFYRVVWTPFAVLEHREAASRGLDTTQAERARVRAEREYLLRTWGALAETDPFLNPNLDVAGERLVLASPLRGGEGAVVAGDQRLGGALPAERGGAGEAGLA